MPFRRLEKNGGVSCRNKKAMFSHLCTRAFVTATAINILAMVSYYFIFVTTAAYVVKNYGASLSLAGMAAGMLELGCLSGRFVSASLFSFVGIRQTLLIGLVFYVGSLAFFPFCDNLGLMFWSRYLTGVGVGLTAAATSTIAAYAIPREEEGFGISIFSLSTALSLALGPFLGILLGDLLPYAMLMRGLFYGLLPCFPLVLLIGRLAVACPRRRPIFNLRSYMDPRVFRFSIVVFLIFMSYGCVQAFITSYAHYSGLTDSASLFFLMYACATILSRPLTGYYLDRLGENRVLFPIFIFCIFGLVLMSNASSAIVLLLAGIFYGLGFGNFQSVGHAVSLSLVTPSRYPQATSTYFILMDLGIATGPFLFGFLIPLINYSGMFLAQCGTVLAAMLLYHILHGRQVTSRIRQLKH